ncbi:MAG TPA: RDD family protein, partial [Flavisolibacter sp.]|nr:RDD family protein [Flavisolibacter sp.]
MPLIRIMTNFNIELDFYPAPFQRRLLAWILDQFVLFLYILLAIKVIEVIPTGMKSSLNEAFIMLFMLPLLLYQPLCEILMNGQSVGKKITGIRVVNEHGGQPGIGQYIIRWLIRTSDYMILIIILFAPTAAQTGNFDFVWKIGVAAALFLTDIILVNTSEKNQRLGDMLAHTLVIRVSKNLSIEDTVFQDISE